ncbi:NAD(P)-dependent oxidoreductase [Paeniroseomonas aquatica]|uniref:NAD(P)-binding domain-containing protein n=1 Tax=Paeniroseomonas aquatica TaxID=373043 RepID=A0ABT8A1M0_9PROT|nr:NAD(P)-binding domain-containing protein [Paeniroseomonas aquatica]MDN3563429.1 NAD(P)-binding domain-containing protein [Paeniroseomonas aquatica]
MDQARDRIGFIGLGRMGCGMASNIRRKQFPLTVHDIAPGPVAALEALGAASAGSAAAVAKASDVVLTMLPGPKEVQALVLGGEGILANLAPGSVVMDMSTVDPETTDALAAACAAKGIGFVDAPVGRLAWHADRGESLFMVGASEADFARVKPLLEAMGTTVHHCGGPGAGTRSKLVNNYLAIILCQLNAEALSLATAFGLDLEKTLEVLHGTTATNGQLKVNWPNKVLAGDIVPGFSIDLAHKDLSLIVQAANAAKVTLPVAAIAREAFSSARGRGWGQKDFSAMLDAQCQLAGIEPPRLKKA